MLMCLNGCCFLHKYAKHNDLKRSKLQTEFVNEFHVLQLECIFNLILIQCTLPNFLASILLLSMLFVSLFFCFAVLCSFVFCIAPVIQSLCVSSLSFIDTCHDFILTSMPSVIQVGSFFYVYRRY